MMFDVQVVEDDELPMEHDYCFIRTPDRMVYVVKKSRATSPWVIREAWIASRRLQESAPHLLRAV